MRLINVDTLRLEQFPDAVAPEYAILSHTWGAGEVTLQNFEAASDQPDSPICASPGYQKIVRACSQSKSQGYQYCWVDTCCIDKTSSAELSESINSMFRWYEAAGNCMVYLEDYVRTPNRSGHSVEPDIAHCRWFTRGWTLQELLAPKHVEFFSGEGQRLGDKASLATLIHGITQIPLAVLRGQALETVSTEERRKWIEGRQTARAEDLAYCQLGIFGVWMVAIYGEGKDSAQRRLEEEIDKLPYTDREFRLHSAFRTIPDHYYTTQDKDDFAIEVGYHFERVECFVWNRREPGTIPVYQYLSTTSGDHFYTPDAEEGHRAKTTSYVFEKVAFFTSPTSTAREGTEMRPLYRLLDTVTAEHFYTAEEEEQIRIQQTSFLAEGHIGFVFPVKTGETVPLYRWYRG
ncbi:HET domain-containing protein [Microdochium nivale]|nr:HET domain-containing protein [Microdochium nivale]